MYNQNKLLLKVRDDYNKIAEHFSQTRQLPWPEFNDFKPFIKPGQRVLDAGCGSGRLYNSFLKDLNLEYHGIDFSERLVEITNRARPASQSEAGESRFVNRDSHPCFTVGDITKLQFQDNYFDVVMCIATFHHLPTKKLRLKALSEMKRVLKPGGYVLMTNWYWWQTMPWKYFFNHWWQKSTFKDLFIPWKNSNGEIMVEHFYYAFTLNELAKLFKQAGFKLEKNYLTSDDKRTGKKSRANIVTIVRK